MKVKFDKVIVSKSGEQFHLQQRKRVLPSAVRPAVRPAPCRCSVLASSVQLSAESALTLVTPQLQLLCFQLVRCNSRVFWRLVLSRVFDGGVWSAAGRGGAC